MSQYSKSFRFLFLAGKAITPNSFRCKPFELADGGRSRVAADCEKEVKYVIVHRGFGVLGHVLIWSVDQVHTVIKTVSCCGYISITIEQNPLTRRPYNSDSFLR